MASKHDILSVLQDVQSGALTPEDALLHLKLAPFEDLGYAKVDYHRAVRQGVPGLSSLSLFRPTGRSIRFHHIMGRPSSFSNRGSIPSSTWPAFWHIS